MLSEGSSFRWTEEHRAPSGHSQAGHQASKGDTGEGRTEVLCPKWETLIPENLTLMSALQLCFL